MDMVPLHQVMKKKYFELLLSQAKLVLKHNCNLMCFTNMLLAVTQLTIYNYQVS